MAYSGLVNKKGSEKEYIQTAKLIKEGLSCEKIADVQDPRCQNNWSLGGSYQSEEPKFSRILFVG